MTSENLNIQLRVAVAKKSLDLFGGYDIHFVNM